MKEDTNPILQWKKDAHDLRIRHRCLTNESKRGECWTEDSTQEIQIKRMRTELWNAKKWVTETEMLNGVLKFQEMSDE